jgi:bifunctional DNase/RNase
MGGNVSHILVKELNDTVFHARLYIDQGGEVLEIDCRPSDAIALAVRVKAPIFIAPEVMEMAGIEPEPDIHEEPTEEEVEPKQVDAFMDFVDTLDFDDFEED